jgi:hypothetical protein
VLVWQAYKSLVGNDVGVPGSSHREGKEKRAIKKWRPPAKDEVFGRRTEEGGKEGKHAHQ